MAGLEHAPVTTGHRVPAGWGVGPADDVEHLGPGAVQGVAPGVGLEFLWWESECHPEVQCDVGRHAGVSGGAIIAIMGKSRDAQRRLQGKHARELARRIRAAGGSVTLTANGHLRVQGPRGVAVVSSSASDPRNLVKALSTIRRYAGLEV